MITPDNKYTQMQRRFYKPLTNPNYDNEEVLNGFEPMKYLYEGIEGGIALDFGCGIGRGMLNLRDHFQRIDGADLMVEYLEQAAAKMPDAIFYPLDGVSLKGVPSNTYDVVYSSSVLQHIPVHEIRFQLLTEMHRVLKPGGWISIEMGYSQKGHTPYFANYYDAPDTNSGHDVMVESVDQIDGDLSAIGFKNFSHHLEGNTQRINDGHEYLIFFRAQK